MPDCPTQPWWLRVWARTPPRTRLVPRRYFIPPQLPFPRVRPSIRPRGSKTCASTCHPRSRACNTRLRSIPARPRWMPCVRWYCRNCWTIPASWRSRSRRPRESSWEPSGRSAIRPASARRLAESGVRVNGAFSSQIVVRRSPTRPLAAIEHAIHVLPQRSLRRRPIARVAERGHATINTCQVSGFVQRTAANPARSGRKQR